MDDEIINDRFDLANGRIDHAFMRIEAVEKRLDDHTDSTLIAETKRTETRRYRYSTVLEIVVVVLVLIEVVQWFYNHHG
jgi:hypothetical protein